MPKDIEDYKTIIKFWKEKYFSHKDYLKIGNKPVVYIYTYHTLIEGLGEEGTKEFISLLKKDSNAYIICVSDGSYLGDRPGAIKTLGFDAISGWNYIYWLKQRDKSKKYEYSTYSEIAEKVWYEADKVSLPVYPSVLPGWDDRPWKQKEAQFVIKNNSPEIFSKILDKAGNYNRKKKYKPGIIMIESWNEFGEGSYIIPTRKWGFKYLEAIKNFKEEQK